MKRVYWYTARMRLQSALIDDDCADGAEVGAPCRSPGCSEVIDAVDYEAWTHECRARHRLPLPAKFARAVYEGVEIVTQDDEMLVPWELPPPAGPG